MDPGVAARTEGPGYEVHLAVFNGPLDLLLHLIQKGELDITVVSLAAVTDQYLAYLATMPVLDTDQLADFLVIAARLIAIKALAIVARPNDRIAPEEEDAEALIRALREYQLFQAAATRLRGWESEQRRAYPRQVPLPPIPLPAPNGLDLTDLITAFRQRLSLTQREEVPQKVPVREYRIEDVVLAIEVALAEKGGLTFAELVPQGVPLIAVIVTFLALLHLLRVQRVAAEQRTPFGEILISPRSGEQRQ